MQKKPVKKSSSSGGRFIVILLLVAIIIAVSIWLLRGCSDSSPQVPEIPQEEKKAEPPPPPKVYKYRKPSENPRFGEQFIYRNAVAGNIPNLPLSQKAGSGILVDLNTREVLWQKNAASGVPIASMTKMMTLLLTFEQLEEREGLTLDTPIKVSVAAYKIGGSQVYLDPRETFSLGELMKSVAIKSANDSAYLIAEYLNDQDIPGFVARMNRRAAELNMPGTRFVNPYGLPNNAGENSISSAEGMAILAEHLLEYPKLLEWTSTVRAPFREPGSPNWQDMTNTNKLVRDCPGVDGMKTGYIGKSGFCLTATCLRGGRRLVGVVTGFDTSANRDKFMRQLLDWGYQRAAELQQ
ncbi:D-alanyl-D-alanine carboxypeptidase family protein [Victivallis sp. Marseille-Q1083]|uniref:D-alanyl-D-alanine carboxypeptidase family protein n=1 Tax=Victivallis sp. Marseille-Q1083 TaxID=2717288 RepID=UPI001588723C|nr:D-alanyl-D-alanine carboxypeptidase family protein [Victivallis sp. Marseille-Q1083]